MPTLDVSDAFDGSFLDDITVVRQTQIVDQYGWVTVTPRVFSIKAVVVAASPNDLARLPEEEYMNKAISVAAIADQNSDGSAVLQGPSDLTLPDEIIWHGSRFIVRTVDDYSGYGRGFVNVTAVSIDAVDPPPAKGAPTPYQGYQH
jgi:galactose-6-phosphate isomerase